MLHEISFKSTNGRDSVQAWIYVPAAKPQGVIQLVHGFGEHSRRYLHMIVKFMEAGYIVAADDHVGHGKTALVNNCWGDWGDKGPHTMMEDEYVFMTGVKQMFPDLPYFMFGHSMGSFIARDFMAKYGDELDGVALCGTSGEFPGLDDSIAYLQNLVDQGKGLESDPEAGNVVMGWMFGRCEEEVTLGNEWICHDPYVQKDHAEDPFDAFTKPTSNRSFLDFCYMMKEITGPEWAAKVPDDLPVYNIGGDQDPVGQYGEGVYKVSNWLTDNGNDVVTELYSGYRHEIHNYAELRDEVEDGILDFFQECLGFPEELLDFLLEEELDQEMEATEDDWSPEVEDDVAPECSEEPVEEPAEKPVQEEGFLEETPEAEVPAGETPVDEVAVTEDPVVPPVIPMVGMTNQPAEVAEVPEPEIPPVAEIPVEPEVAAMPEAPSMPEIPEMLVVPETPIAPEVPAAVEMPAAPEVPVAPEIPKAPEAPEVPAFTLPETPKAPEPSVIPDFQMPEMPDVQQAATDKIDNLEAQLKDAGEAVAEKVSETAETVQQEVKQEAKQKTGFMSFFRRD